MAKNDSRESRAAEAERRRKLEGNTLFSDLGEPIQKLLLQISKDVSDSELQKFSKVTVRQLAKVFDMLAVEEDPDKILAWLRRELDKNDPNNPANKKHRQQVKTGASRDAVAFYQELEKKNIELMERMKEASVEREAKRSANIAERKKRREQAVKEAAEARERAEKTGETVKAVDSLKKKDLSSIVGHFDNFTSKNSTFDNSNANQDTEWWKQEEFRRDFEKNGRKGKAWTRVVSGGSSACPDSELAVREEWFRAQCWWKSDKYKRDWLASRDAEWWKEETYIRDWQDNGDKGLMWVAADELSGFNRKGDRRTASENELARRMQWYQNNGPKGIVKNWCALSEGSADRCTLEEKREREDFFKNGDWWKTDEITLKVGSAGRKPTASDSIFLAGASGQDREWWKSEEYRQDFLKGGNTWKAISEKAAVKGEDVQATSNEAEKREEWYQDYWWKADKYVQDFNKNGNDGKLWKARNEEETANGDKAKPCKESEGKLRENWFKTADDREWWKGEEYLRDWQENGANGKKWLAGWQDAGEAATGDVDKAKADVIAKREKWYNDNWWKTDKYVKDFQAHGSKGTAWKCSNKDTHSDTDWWKEGDFIKQWSAKKKNDGTPFWQQPAYIEDYWKKGSDGKKWIAGNAAAGSMNKGDEVQATPEDLAAREAFYQQNWWQSPECQRDFAANGRDGKRWTATDAQGTGKASPKELKAREAHFEKAFTPGYNAMFESDATVHTVPTPATHEEIVEREEYYKKNWWKRPEVKEDYMTNGTNGKLFKAATAEVAALDEGDKAEYQASPEELAERAAWFDAGSTEEEWWQDEVFKKEAAAAKDPVFWHNTDAVDDYLKNGANGKVWKAATAAAASTATGDAHPADATELAEREDWLKKNFWRSSECKADFAKNGEKGALWTTSEPNGKGQTVSDQELKSRMAFFRPTHAYESAEKPKEGSTGAGSLPTSCGLGEAQDREEWFEKNWWKSPEVAEDYKKHGTNGKLFKAATHDAAALDLGGDPMYQASPEELAERQQYFETCDDRDWWKDPAILEDYQKNGEAGAKWQSRNSKEAAMSMGQETPTTADEIEERKEWFEKNFWKNPAAVEDFTKNGNKGTVWKQATAGEDAAEASPEELAAREQWFEAHTACSDVDVEARKEWFQRQLTDEEKVARRDWVVKQNVESKKIASDELSDVLAALNDGQAPSQEQLAAIEDVIKKRRTELYGEEEVDADAVTQEEFVTAVAETNFYVPQTEEELLRAEEEALEAMEAEENMRLLEEAEFLKLEAEEERAAAGEDWVDEGAADDEEQAYLDAMEAENELQAQPNEDDVQYTQEEEDAWNEYLEKQGDEELSPEQLAELEAQEEERLAAEAAREAADAAAWNTEELGEEVEEGVEEEPVDEAADLIEENKEELEALVQEDGEDWGGEEEEWEEGEGEEVVEEVDELLNEEKGQPHQWKLPLREVTNPQYLKSYFTVIKYTPSHSFLGGKQKRIWVVDHFTRCFYNLDKSGKIKKEHAANKLLQLERNILDSNRLRLMFFDASHSYELQFQNPEERERFYESASAIRPSIRVYAPDLTNQDASVEACTTTIDGVGPEAVTVTCNNASGKPVARELTGECKVNASKLLTEPLTIWTGTFNLSGHHPPRNPQVLGQWMPKDKYDIYAVAVQEASYRKEESEWFEFIQAYLGKDYLSLASMNLWDTLLIVLCRKKHLLKITNVEGSTKATIHKSVCGTKGGIGISLRYLETSMCFVTCHLAARLERNAMRNTNLEEIFDCLQLGVRETDYCNQFNHVFMFGDFNYRVELDTATAEKLLEDGKASQLLDYDQFNMQKEAEGICHGFQEPPITFSPTYRMQIGEEKYMAERGNAPSFCDRVITRSMSNTWVKCTSYKSHPQVQTSEHLPVSATFIIRCVRPVMAAFMKSQSPIPMFVFEEINFVESTGPIIKKPAMMIQSPFSKINKHVEAKTTQTATPFWDGAALPKLSSVTQAQEFLETCHIMLIVREAAEKREDKMHRGTGLITLFGRVMGVQDVQQEFETDVMAHGRCIGKITGKFHWEPAPLAA